MLDTKKICRSSIILALIILMGLSPIGYIQFGVVNITILPACVILITCLMGLYYGIIAGIGFGLTSLFRAILFPGLFSPFFINPVISIIPRIVFVFFTFIIFKFLLKVINNVNEKKKIIIASTITSILGTILHTFFTLYTIWMFKNIYLMYIDTDKLWSVIIGLVSTNMVVEIIVSVILVDILLPTLSKIKLN